MSEPLNERTEEFWITHLNRFDSEIWPLFESRGYTKGEAHILWILVGLQESTDDVERAVRELREKYDD